MGVGVDGGGEAVWQANKHDLILLNHSTISERSVDDGESFSDDRSSSTHGPTFEIYLIWDNEETGVLFISQLVGPLDAVLSINSEVVGKCAHRFDDKQYDGRMHLN